MFSSWLIGCWQESVVTHHLTAQLALQHGLAVSTAVGRHHAFADAGSGFCILNDLAYTAHWLLAKGALQRVLILDLDVHQVRCGVCPVTEPELCNCACTGSSPAQTVRRDGGLFVWKYRFWQVAGAATAAAAAAGAGTV
jgi:hypothetical protein